MQLLSGTQQINFPHKHHTMAKKMQELLEQGFSTCGPWQPMKEFVMANGPWPDIMEIDLSF